MLSEEEAISILELNQVTIKTVKFGSQTHIKAKLSHDYSFHVKPDESKPGYLLAYLNNSNSGVLATWNEINDKSLALAIKNVKELLDIEIQNSNSIAIINNEVEELKSLGHIVSSEKNSPEKIRFSETVTENKSLNKQPWLNSAMIVLFLMLLGFGYFAANRLIAMCDRERLEIQTPKF
jgi:hypothetical protein